MFRIIPPLVINQAGSGKKMISEPKNANSLMDNTRNLAQGDETAAYKGVLTKLLFLLGAVPDHGDDVEDETLMQGLDALLTLDEENPDLFKPIREAAQAKTTPPPATGNTMALGAGIGVPQDGQARMKDGRPLSAFFGHSEKDLREVDKTYGTQP